MAKIFYLRREMWCALPRILLYSVAETVGGRCLTFGSVCARSLAGTSLDTENTLKYLKAVLYNP